MRIPLDYYRILGLPIQATTEQLSQAYRDRALQLPRREYSEVAIASRKELLDEAYGVLSDAEQRSAYDGSFLTKTYEVESKEPRGLSSSREGEVAGNGTVDPHSPSIEIKSEQFVGALLILQELGEYELVLKLAQPYLTSGDSISLDKGRLGDPQLVRPDIVLTLALACLELGREQWQQGQYENAATSLETGQELLLHEGVFPTVRGEIQADLYKLRPYRILELLALPDENVMERRKGLQLLQDMLQERMGIDGTGDDQSGLSIDDFLRFIQQLRAYLTAAQQQTLFEAEARRPSAVATYLAVYALIARGFAERQPALIARAKQMLLRLGKRQDVHLEQSVCALLLGQTEEANRALELSQEYEPLAFIREHSQGSPDLLPGLCLYGERWLQNSVFPHFRDLSNCKAPLKDYFADEQVQAYLENLPDPVAEASQEWAVESQRRAYATTTRGTTGTSLGRAASYKEGEQRVNRQPIGVSSRSTLERDTRTTATVGATSRVSTLPTHPSQSLLVEPPQGPESGEGKGRQPNGSSDALSSPPVGNGVASGLGSGSVDRDPPGRLQRLPDRSKSTQKVKQRVFLLIAGLLGLGLVVWIIHKMLASSSTPALEGEQAMVELEKPPVAIPEPDTQLTAPGGPMTEETAQQAIQVWLGIKAQALGSDHQVTELSKILVDPMLSVWRRKAEAAKQSNSYWQYEHQVKVTSVQVNAANPNQAKVDAAVKEVARFYQGGQLNQSTSYSDNLNVEYELVRQRDQWFIKNNDVR